MFQDFDFVAIRVRDEGHLFSVLERFTPVSGPKVDFQSQSRQHFAVGGDIVDPNAGMGEVLRDLHFVIVGKGKLQLVRTARYLKVGQLIAAGGFIRALEHFKAASAAIPVNGFLQIGDSDAGVVKCDRHDTGRGMGDAGCGMGDGRCGMRDARGGFVNAW